MYVPNQLIVTLKDSTGIDNLKDYLSINGGTIKKVNKLSILIEVPDLEEYRKKLSMKDFVARVSLNNIAKAI